MSTILYPKLSRVERAILSLLLHLAFEDIVKAHHLPLKEAFKITA